MCTTCLHDVVVGTGGSVVVVDVDDVDVLVVVLVVVEEGPDVEVVDGAIVVPATVDVAPTAVDDVANVVWTTPVSDDWMRSLQPTSARPTSAIPSPRSLILRSRPTPRPRAGTSRPARVRSSPRGGR